MKPVTWTTPSKKGQLTCHIGALLVVAMWGGSFVATKVLTEHGLGPVEIYIYRFVLAYILVLISCHKNCWHTTGATNCSSLPAACAAAQYTSSRKTLL